MGDSDVDDIFEDFGDKVEDKPHAAKEQLSEEEILKRKYQKSEQELKEKHRKEKEALEEKRKRELRGHEEVPGKSSSNIEKIAYIAIILVLAVYIAIDFSFYHGGKTVNIETDTITAAAVQEEDKIKEIVEEVEETVEEEPVEEEQELSGVIAMGIVDIYTEVPDEDEDFGYMSKIVFIIHNGKDKVLKPYVEVFVYDSENQDSYETRSRGHYTYNNGIKPGDNHTGIIDLVPTTWTHLDLKKNIRLVMNDTDGNFIRAITQKVTIS